MGGRGINILFLTLYPGVAASPRYRVEQFLPHLQERGFRCTVWSALTSEEYGRQLTPRRYHVLETRRRVHQLLRARSFDIVFVQKAIMTAYLRGMYGLLRSVAKRLVFDIDDAVHTSAPHSLRGIWRFAEDTDQVKRVMQSADLVLAGNQWLADEARAHARRVEHFPTVVDTNRFVPGTSPREDFVIGWMGGASTTPHLSVVSHLNTMEDVRMRCIGADPARVPFRFADVPEWVYEREVEELQQFSVGIMPLRRDEWTRGKCALKALQYMACGVPCVATPYGAITDMATHDVNILFADSETEWREAITRLRDPQERKRIGEAGRALVENRYSLAKAAPALAELLESVL